MMLRNLLLLLVFVIIGFGDVERRTLANENPGFLSIDCGVNKDYFDEATGIWFKSDKEFISTGVNHEILPVYDIDNEHFGKRYKTLRSFPNGTKNCYTLKLDKPKNKSFRIRASFLYGNYDGKSQNPTFQIYLGVNYWGTVEIHSVDEWGHFEIVHFFTSDTEYFCLVNTGTGTPFISSLEIRPSNISTYGNVSSLEIYSYDLGSGVGQEMGIRYKDDIYDRIWFPYQLPSSVPINTSSDIDTQGSSNLYKLPVEVFRTAVKPSDGSNSLTYSENFDLDYKYNVYFHFAELEHFEDKVREISITVNGITQGPFTLVYLKPLSISFQRLRTTAEGNITFTIATSTDSRIPPILSAFEVYQVEQFQLSATHQSDVDAIMSIKRTYYKDDWQGDPCLPKVTSWTGLSCRFDRTPRIISLNLSSSKLTGEISPSLAHLLEIESIDLSYNDLTGSVPEFLASLPKLKVLNISGNKLKGPIPQSLKDKSDKGSMLLSFTEKQNSCQRDPCEGNNKKFVVPVVVSIIAAMALIIVLSVLIIFHIKKRRKLTGVANKEGLLKSKNRSFTYSEIVRITSNFENEIGKGGFGKVFRGQLHDDTLVAVKLLYSSSKHKEFQAEAQPLMIIHHKNLVSLIGYCKDDDHMSLIYEFMPKGNLREHLSGSNETVLNWKQRVQIAVDVAQGLDYLHNGCKPPIVHRDLKPANILLNENMQAKIADFGLSRIFSTETASNTLTCPAGTFGYLDPEFHRSRCLNKKVDVYSFGVVLFELITGQPAIITSNEYNIHIVEWVTPIIEEGDIRKIVDPRLQNEFDTDAAWKAVEIARSCVQPTSKQRPDISHVLAELKECRALEMAVGRNDERVQSEMTYLEMESDILALAR